MDTEVRRIDLAMVDDLDQAIQDLCMVLGAADFRLASTFIFQNQLVLIFQGNE